MHTRYRFKGNAYAASGVITTPFKDIIEVQAPATLAEIGGFGATHVHGFRHRDILHFERAHSEVTGSETHIGDLNKPGQTFSTLVRSTVEGLNILGMVTADKVVAHLVSTFRTGGDDAHPENSVRLIGSHFHNLKIAGHHVHLDMAVGTLDKYHHHQDLVSKFPHDKAVRDLFGDDDLKKRHATAPQEVKNFLCAPPSDRDEMPAVTSIVRGFRIDGDPVETYGHVVHIEGFGTIRLGEVRLCKHTRHLTMIQIHLGCPYEGDVSITSTADGGSGN